MENTKFLTGLVAITLLLSLVNLYSTFSLSKKFEGISELKDAKVAKNLDAPITGNKPNTPTPPAPSAEATDKKINVSIDDDAIKGDPKAPVTIVEFSDFECGFCAKFYQNAYKQIDEEYIKTGKVKLVYRDFPLSFHKNAQKAAEAAECAGEQDKYYEMHDILFENYRNLDEHLLPDYAKEIGLNMSQFNSCLDSDLMAEEVKTDFNDGRSVGVTGTPAFYINGTKITGAQSFEKFKQIIDQELFKTK